MWPALVLATLGAIVPVVLAKVAPGFPIWLGLGVSMVPALFYWFRYTRDREQVRRLLTDYGRSICLECRYPLNALANEGTCPECGVAYDKQSTAHRWRTWEETVSRDLEPMVPLNHRGRLIGPEGQILPRPQSDLELPIARPAVSPFWGSNSSKYISAALLVVWIGIGLLAQFGINSGLVPLAPALVFVLGSIAYQVMMHRVRKQVQRVDQAACLRCLHDLRIHSDGLTSWPDHGRCTECGQVYQRSLTQLAWKKYLHRSMLGG